MWLGKGVKIKKKPLHLFLYNHVVKEERQHKNSYKKVAETLFEDLSWNHRRKRFCSLIIITCVKYQIQETVWRRSDKFPYYSLSLNCFRPHRAKTWDEEQA